MIVQTSSVNYVIIITQHSDWLQDFLSKQSWLQLLTYLNGSAVLLSDYQESHIREEEEKLEEETQETNLEFHQQLVTEIQEALQFLQQHMEQVIGQTLLQCARGEAEKKSSDDGQDFKVWKWSIAVFQTKQGLPCTDRKQFNVCINLCLEVSAEDC